MNRNELTYRVKESVKSLDPKAKVILFGSKARGDSRTTSDWDFLILASANPSEKYKKAIRDKLLDTELEAGEVISTIIFSKRKWNDYQITPLYKNIIKDGIEL
jgi:predicted nucleotidyltransferase